MEDDECILKKDFLGEELCGVSLRTPSYFFVSYTKKWPKKVTTIEG